MYALQILRTNLYGRSARPKSWTSSALRGSFGPGSPSSVSLRSRAVPGSSRYGASSARGGRKIRYGRLLVEALAPTRIPPPLDGLFRDL